MRLVDYHAVAVAVAHEFARIATNQERCHRMIKQEVHFIKIVLHNVVCHSQRKSSIRAGFYRNEFVRITSSAVEEQTDVDDLGTVALSLNDMLCETVLVFNRVRAPYDNVIGVIDVARIGIVVTIRVTQVIVRRKQRAVVEAVCLHGERCAVQTAKARVQHTGKTHRGRIACS